MKHSNHPYLAGAIEFVVIVVLLATSAPLLAEITVSDKTVVSGETYEVGDLSQVVTSGTVEVQSGGTAIFRSSGTVLLQPGFTATAGAFFHASINLSFTVPLAWTASAGAVRYDIYRDGVKIGETTDLTFTDLTAQAGVTHSYTIKAIASGGGGITIATFNATTAGSFEIFTPLAQ